MAKTDGTAAIDGPGSPAPHAAAYLAGDGVGRDPWYSPEVPGVESSKWSP